MDTIYKSVHESSSNQHCGNLIKWMQPRSKEPDPKAEDPEEQFLGKFLERKRSGRAKPYESDQELLSQTCFPNLFDKADTVKQQVAMAHEVCALLKANGGKIPSRTQGEAKMRQIGHWIRNRRAAAHGAIHLNVPEEVVQVFRDANMLQILHISDK